MATPSPAGAAGDPEARLLWERPWTLEEVRGESQAWSLAADAGLLRFLQEFSQQTISRTHEIKKQMDGLVQETKNTDCRLHNVFNGFLMLSNTQFIENRVYDEEVEESPPRADVGDKPEQEKTREQKEADLIPKIQEAVNYGMQVLDSAFEQLDIKAGNSDSEEETNEKVELILEPKDLYVDRPLPYLIGSQLFMEQDDVGLGDLSSEGSVDSDRGSMVDSEGKDEEELEEEFGDASEDEQKPGTALVSDEEDDDLFGGDSEKGEDDEDDVEENSRLLQKKKRPTSFTDQLAARIKGDQPQKRNKEQLASADIKNQNAEKEKEVVGVPSDEDDDLFCPPKLTDEDFSPFASTGGLFSGGMGLFEEEESDLFAELPKGEDAVEKDERVPINDEPSSKAVRKVPAGAVFLFPGGNDVFSPSSLLTEKEDKKAAEPVAERAPKHHTGPSLFDDDDFHVRRSDPVPKASKSGADLFGDDEEDLFKEKLDAARMVKDAPKEAEAGQGPIVRDKSQPPSTESFKPSTPVVPKDHKNLFSDEEDSEDLFSSSRSSKSSALPSKGSTKAPLSLFEDEDEEELFGSLPVKAPVSKPPLEKSSRLLFSSDEEDHWNPGAAVKPASEGSQKKEVAKAAVAGPKKSLFEEDEKEEDLFALTKDSQRKTQKAALLFEEDAVNGDSLFDVQPSLLPSSTQAVTGKGHTPDPLPPGEQADLLETAQKETVKEKTVAHDESDAPPEALGPGEDLAEQQKAEESPLEKDTRRKTKSVFSLFEDEEKTGDADAGRNTQKDIEKPPEKSARPKSTGVFQDEELLFSHKMEKDNDPDVDLFASNRKGVPKPRGKLPFGGGLFGDDDGEDGLFSSAKAKPLESTRPASSKPKEPAPRIGKLQASLDINPAALLPGGARKPSPPHREPHGVQRTQAAPSAGNSEETGVSFDHPVQADTLHNANKDRIKITKKRRPPSRATRRVAAQKSCENEGSGTEDPPLRPLAESPMPPLATPSTKGAREKQKLLPTTSGSDQLCKTDDGPVSKSTAPPDAVDLFESGDLFEVSREPKVTSKPKAKLRTEDPASRAPKDGEGLPVPSLLGDSNGEDLFRPARPSKKSSPASFLDGQEDLFGSKQPLKRKAAKPTPSSEVAPTSKDIFEDDIFSSEAVKLPPAQAKELEASLFDDDVDIFADLAVKPKERSSKKKVEAKSIFDEDMDDIFMPTSQSKSQTKKAPPVEIPSGAKPEPKASSTFEDPLNAFEGR
ncbi:WASH complex subunit 2-like isoform X1 [Sphaerodactylus townsendi]|uniref:WASH complex subunit 2-like isoform X1 n=1 Tax=Sphaerodactylus townsendi TaxID=933632 RepID=UPI002026083F|nr:WASH complex subunit 2-like isoform X1 [Sphaerodactylus townsendi]